MKKCMFFMIVILTIIFCFSGCVHQSLKNDETVYELSVVDKAPRAISTFPPMSPYLARKEKISGTVVARFIVTKEGKTENISIVESDNSIFNDTVLKAIEKYIYSPGKKNGVPVNVIIDLPITFDLED